MSEKRKPIAKLFAERNGKRAKVEIFPASLFSQRVLGWRKPSDRVFRLRVNGKWFPKGDVRFFNRTEIRDIFWRSFHF